MDTNAFKKAVDVLSHEKGIEEDIIYDAMELALSSAYKKNYSSLSNVRVDINRDSGEIHVYSFKTVVDEPDEHGIINSKEIEAYELAHPEEDDEPEDDETSNGEEIEVSLEETEEAKEEEVRAIFYDSRIHLTLEEARKIVPNIEIGETIEEEVTPKDFGRVAASTAKQVVVQKIREAERNNIVEEFSNKQDELVTGIVEMHDARNYYVNLGKVQGILPKTETIPGETIKINSSIKVYITKVDVSGKGPLILLSRNHYGFVKR